MLEPYSFKYTGKKKTKTPPTLTYSFKDKDNRKYMMEVECYAHNLYAIKFYLHHFRESDNKFQILTNFGQPGRLIGTCIALIVELFKAYPRASFGFIGINSIGEKKANTKRYRVYRKAIEFKFSNINFVHQKYPDQSLYVLVNRRALANDPSLIQKLERTIEPLITEYFKAEQEEVIANTRRRGR